MNRRVQILGKKRRSSQIFFQTKKILYFFLYFSVILGLVFGSHARIQNLRRVVGTGRSSLDIDVEEPSGPQILIYSPAMP